MYRLRVEPLEFVQAEQKLIVVGDQVWVGAIRTFSVEAGSHLVFDRALPQRPSSPDQRRRIIAGIRNERLYLFMESARYVGRPVFCGFAHGGNFVLRRMILA